MVQNQLKGPTKQTDKDLLIQRLLHPLAEVSLQPHPARVPKNMRASRDAAIRRNKTTVAMTRIWTLRFLLSAFCHVVFVFSQCSQRRVLAPQIKWDCAGTLLAPPSSHVASHLSYLHGSSVRQTRRAYVTHRSRPTSPYPFLDARQIRGLFVPHTSFSTSSLFPHLPYIWYCTVTPYALSPLACTLVLVTYSTYHRTRVSSVFLSPP